MQVHHVAHENAILLLDGSLCTPLADAFYNSLAEDQHGNITAEFDIKGDKHTITLNTKVKRSCDLLSVKEKLVECKKNILQCMAENIIDQTREYSLSSFMRAFDLLSEESFEARVKKIESLHNIYGLDSTHILEDWNDLSVKVVYKKRLTCSKESLINKYKVTFEQMNTMAQQLKVATRNEKSQKVMWQNFLKTNEMPCGDMCKLISLMVSIPANTGWIKHAYSILELICQGRRNRLSTDTMKNLFLLGVLKLKVKDAFAYDQEVENLLEVHKQYSSCIEL